MKPLRLFQALGFAALFLNPAQAHTDSRHGKVSQGESFTGGNSIVSGGNPQPSFVSKGEAEPGSPAVEVLQGPGTIESTANDDPFRDVSSSGKSEDAVEAGGQKAEDEAIHSSEGRRNPSKKITSR